MTDDKPPPVTILWTERARRDLTAIGDYIALDNRPAAELWVGLLISDVERAAEMPLAGRVVPEYERTEIREVIRGRYRIVYRLFHHAIQVLTIFEGHRLFPKGAVADEAGEE